MEESTPMYTSFIVRLWRESETDWEWLAQVELIPSSETRYFGSLREMFLYIEREIAEDLPPVDTADLLLRNSRNSCT